MSAPTLALTFKDLQIRVAEYLGVADYTSGPAGVPTDAGDLEKVKRLVNDGYRRFINANDRWQFLTPIFTISFKQSYTGTATGGSTTTLVDTTRTEATGTFNGFGMSLTSGTGSGEVATVSTWNLATHTFTFTSAITTAPDTTTAYQTADPACVAGDNSRYYMPDGFYGSVLVPFTYPIAGPKLRIETIHEERIRELNASGAASGDPSLVAFRPLPASVLVAAPRWEAIFWPAPNNLYTVTSRARFFPDALVNDTDYHVAGFQHDETMLKSCIAEAERDVEDSTGVREKAFQVALAQSLAVDKQASAKKLGDYGDRSEGRASRWQRPSNYGVVDTYNGLPV